MKVPKFNMIYIIYSFPQNFHGISTYQISVDFNLESKFRVKLVNFTTFSAEFLRNLKLMKVPKFNMIYIIYSFPQNFHGIST